jgi:hypothetical protein
MPIPSQAQMAVGTYSIHLPRCGAAGVWPSRAAGTQKHLDKRNDGMTLDKGPDRKYASLLCH